MKKPLLLALLMALAVSAAANPVLMISVDGLRSRDVTDAPARGMKLPHLRALMAGAWAEGVKDMLPSITYPNHTTLMTGVAPALHGITANQTFDPERKNLDGWYWYARDVKVPTLFDAVKAAGGSSINMSWPVTVGNRAITASVPQYWRAYTADDLKVLEALSTPGLVDRIEHKYGATLASTFANTAAGDAAKGRFAAAMIADVHPLFSAVYFASLDETEHEFGPGTPQAKANLEALDATIGTLIEAARKIEPDVVVALVSDHGFAAIDKDVNLIPSFVEAGLVTLEDGKVKSWRAMPWYAAGSEPIMLADPRDSATRQKVRAILERLKADPASGIADIIDRAEIARRGGGTEPDFWVNLKPGYRAGKALTGPLITPSTDKGTHGYFPEWPEMRSTFLMEGPGVPKKALGEIDMRDIAPTIAKVMGAPLPGAKGKPLF